MASDANSPESTSTQPVPNPLQQYLSSADAEAVKLALIKTKYGTAATTKDKKVKGGLGGLVRGENARRAKAGLPLIRTTIKPSQDDDATTGSVTPSIAVAPSNTSTPAPSGDLGPSDTKKRKLTDDRLSGDFNPSKQVLAALAKETATPTLSFTPTKPGVPGTEGISKHVKYEYHIKAGDVVKLPQGTFRLSNNVNSLADTPRFWSLFSNSLADARDKLKSRAASYGNLLTASQTEALSDVTAHLYPSLMNAQTGLLYKKTAATDQLKVNSLKAFVTQLATKVTSLEEEVKDLKAVDMKGKYKNLDALTKHLTTLPEEPKYILQTEHAEHVAALQDLLGFTGEQIRKELAASGAVVSNMLQEVKKIRAVCMVSLEFLIEAVGSAALGLMEVDEEELLDDTADATKVHNQIAPPQDTPAGSIPILLLHLLEGHKCCCLQCDPKVLERLMGDAKKQIRDEYVMELGRTEMRKEVSAWLDDNRELVLEEERDKLRDEAKSEHELALRAEQKQQIREEERAKLAAEYNKEKEAQLKKQILQDFAAAKKEAAAKRDRDREAENERLRQLAKEEDELTSSYFKDESVE
ncbi:MAG: hypothetical protein Q9195_007409 [Heterodermia aff. obscurata]